MAERGRIPVSAGHAGQRVGRDDVGKLMAGHLRIIWYWGGQGTSGVISSNCLSTWLYTTRHVLQAGSSNPDDLPGTSNAERYGAAGSEQFSIWRGLSGRGLLVMINPAHVSLMDAVSLRHEYGRDSPNAINCSPT